MVCADANDNVSVWESEPAPSETSLEKWGAEKRTRGSVGIRGLSDQLCVVRALRSPDQESFSTFEGDLESRLWRIYDAKEISDYQTRDNRRPLVAADRAAHTTVLGHRASFDFRQHASCSPPPSGPSSVVD